MSEAEHVILDSGSKKNCMRISLSEFNGTPILNIRNYFEKDGQRYSHTIDPLTGYPVKHALTSVTVIMPTCSMADAWATALNVAGPDAGMALAEANDLPVYMIIRDGDGFREETSSAFARNFSNNQL